MEPLMYGGNQERSLVPGTESVAAVVGLTEAFVQAQDNTIKFNEHMNDLRKAFLRVSQNFQTLLSMALQTAIIL